MASMKLPLSLLRSFLDLQETPQQIAETLTLLGIEVDAIESEAIEYKGVVIGEVRAVKPHPNSNKLQIATVWDGGKAHEIVCGAANCRAGIRVPFARLGAQLPGLTIQKAEIRGVVSEGMLCAADELGLPNTVDGLLELPANAPIGHPAEELLWDPVFVLSFTPNLGHCLSAFGIARELSAALEIPLKIPTVHSLPSEKTVKTEANCPRYMGRLFENVNIAPSPFWLERQLLAAGMTPRNNGVDITNYILLKWGQPLHAFDADKLKGHLRVLPLAQETPFKTLDSVDRLLPAGTLVIADERGPVAIAGIMGGWDTAVSPETHRIFLEVANFTDIRKTAKLLGLRSESALRFEKGVDPSLAPLALQEASALFEQLAGARAAPKCVDTHPAPFPQKKLRCRLRRVNQVLGSRLSLSELEHLFARLDLHPQSTGHETLEVTVPLYRLDLQEEIDLVEEAARIYGYNNLERRTPHFSSTSIPHDPLFLFTALLKKQLVALGLQEFLCSDLISPQLAALIPNIDPLKALRAKSEEYSTLRPSLLPGLLQAAQHNAAHQTFSLNAFEIGKIHFRRIDPVETSMLGLLLCGTEAPHHWETKSRPTDFYLLKGKIEALCHSLKLTPTFGHSTHPLFHPGRQAVLTIDSEAIGTLGELHPELTEKFGLKERMFYAELHVDALLKRWRPHVQMEPLPAYPASERDWTVSTDKTAAHFFEAIRSFHSPLLESFALLDLYDHDKGRNLTFRFVYRDPLKTISTEEVEAVHAKLLAHINN